LNGFAEEQLAAELLDIVESDKMDSYTVTGI
jgi:hypothetical protein